MLRTNEELIAMIRKATARREGFNQTAQLLPLMEEMETALASGMSRKTPCKIHLLAGENISCKRSQDAIKELVRNFVLEHVC
ncbi:MAG: hypothetical protein FWG01_03370 [Betaproteobacteria bacterium]|nr:hypothetical protein [Betaproteobacteria bacterium]